MDLVAVEIESILYEQAVTELAELIAMRQGPRELHLVQTTATLLEHLDNREKLASIAAMALVMLTEEKEKNASRFHRPAGAVPRGRYR